MQSTCNTALVDICHLIFSSDALLAVAEEVACRLRHPVSKHDQEA